MHFGYTKKDHLLKGMILDTKKKGFQGRDDDVSNSLTKKNKKMMRVINQV